MPIDFLEECTTKEGGLYWCGASYIDWNVGDNVVTLDGLFTAEALREIADFMDNLYESRIEQMNKVREK